MKPATLVLAALLVTLAAAPALRAESTPEALVKSTVVDVLAVMKEHKDPKAVREFAEQKVVQHFDFQEMTRTAAGQAWRQANATQQQALVNGFRTLLVNVYSRSLSSDGAGEAVVDVKPARTQPGQKEVTVRTLVRNGSRPPVPIDYAMAKGAAGWKVNDVIVENISLVSTYRSSFAQEFSRGGVDGLIRALEQKNRGTTKS